jgi:hypothetical protein
MLTSGYQLSPQQARVWAIHAVQPVPVCQCAIWVNGLLHPIVFWQALQQLVQRHEILRTSFQRVPLMDLPLQVISDDVQVSCPYVDLSRLSTPRQMTEGEISFAALSQAPTGLTASSLLSVVLLRLSAQSHLLLLSLPALCADAHTLRYLVGELGQCYLSCLQGLPWDELPLQYVDVCAWLEEAQFSQAGQPAVGHPVGSFVPAVQEVPPIDRHVIAHMRQLADSMHVSLDACLLACWQILLWRMFDRRDLAVTVACDGRNYEGLADALCNALGPYTSFVPLAVVLDEELSLAHIIKVAQLYLQETTQRRNSFAYDAQGVQDAVMASNYAPAFSFESEYWPASFAVGEMTWRLHRRSCYMEPFAL